VPWEDVSHAPSPPSPAAAGSDHFRCGTPFIFESVKAWTPEGLAVANRTLLNATPRVVHASDRRPAVPAGIGFDPPRASPVLFTPKDRFIGSIPDDDRFRPATDPFGHLPVADLAYGHEHSSYLVSWRWSRRVVTRGEFPILTWAFGSNVHRPLSLGWATKASNGWKGTRANSRPDDGWWDREATRRMAGHRCCAGKWIRRCWRSADPWSARNGWPSG
jgi:hypothetical protein